MIARGIGELAAGIAGTKAQKRTHQPVRRNSRHAGERELEMWRTANRFSAKERAERLRAAKEYDRQHKLPGRVMGPLGRVAIEIYDELMGIRDFRTGRLDPALATIARRLRISKQTLVSALKRLKSHGFIDWYRRTRPVEDPEPGGPVVEQDTNAYWFKLPSWAAQRVKAALKAIGLPADFAAHRRAQGDDVAAMLATATADERIDYRVDEGDGLSDALRALQGSLSKRGAASPAAGLNPAREVK